MRRLWCLVSTDRTLIANDVVLQERRVDLFRMDKVTRESDVLLFPSRKAAELAFDRINAIHHNFYIREERNRFTAIATVPLDILPAHAILDPKILGHAP